MATAALPGIARLRERLDERRRRRDEVEVRAQALVAADEERLTGARRRHVGLGDAWGEFWRHPSPWLIAGSLVASAVARVVVGGFSWVDLAVPAVMLLAFPFVEWVVHVFVLHLKPFDVGSFTVDPLVSRMHRAHHRDPRDIPLVFIPFPVLVQVLVLNVAVAFWVAPRAGLALTWLTVLTAVGFVYEWTHYLIHSDHRPVTAAYRAIWRNHRLHHYKNENYWFSVTTAGTSDRVLGTYPDPATVATSPTARDLDARR